MMSWVDVSAAPGDYLSDRANQMRRDALRTIAGSAAALRDAVAGSTASGCITFETVVRQDAGGPDACTVTSGGGTSAATLSGTDCAIELDLFISNWGCHTGGIGANRLRTWQGRYGSDAELPAGISGAPEPACTSDADCAAIGYDDVYYGGCWDTDMPSDFVPDTCRRTWGDTSIDPNVVMNLFACDSSEYTCGALDNTVGPMADSGFKHYAMTARMLVDPYSLGTIVIPLLDPGTGTFVIMGDQSTPPIGKIIDASVTIETGRCCTTPCVDDATRDECGDDELFGPGLQCPETGGPVCLTPGLGACCDRISGLCSDGVPSANCAGQFEQFSEGAFCDDVACDLIVVGACCDGAIGTCEDTVAQDDCVGTDETFFANLLCAQIECLTNPIPTVSEWGLIVLTLTLLAAGKISFGRRRAA